jgi:hypothetical protein
MILFKRQQLQYVVAAGNAVASQIQALVDLMLRTQTVVACDRFYKRPHPGRKHLVKFPRKLAPFTRSDQKWDPGAVSHTPLVASHLDQ